MYQFTNEQRRCFGLDLVRSDWSLIQLKTGRFDRHEAYAYLDGRTVKKCIFVSERQYLEYDYDEQLSDDLTLLLPKTAKGKPARLFSAASSA